MLRYEPPSLGPHVPMQLLGSGVPYPQKWATGQRLALARDSYGVVRARATKVLAPVQIEEIAESAGVNNEWIPADAERKRQRIRVPMRS